MEWQFLYAMNLWTCIFILCDTFLFTKLPADFYFDQQKKNFFLLIFLGSCRFVLINHDIYLTVQLVEHNVDVIEHRVRVVGIIEVGVAFCRCWRRHSSARTAKWNCSWRWRVWRWCRWRWCRLWQFAIQLTLLDRSCIFICKRNLIDWVNWRVRLK